MNNIEAAFILIRAEADRRIEDANHHDYVSTLYEVMMEVSAKCGELMKIKREIERHPIQVGRLKTVIKQ